MGNKAKKLLMLCVLLLGCVLTSLWTYASDKDNGGDKVNQLIAVSQAEKERQQSRPMKIYVSGAVLMPGIYDVAMGARAYDAVEAAGGMTNEADADRVNLAKKLKDGDHVNVPYVKQARKRGNAATKSQKTTNAAVTNNNIGVNVNTASLSELESLPGIGPAMAKRIIAEREKAPFASVDDLLRVKGIGKAKLAKLRSRVRVS